MLKQEDEGGFTLVELLVAMTIMLVVVGALLSALDSLTGAAGTTSIRIDDEQAARLTLAQFTRDVHGASQVTVAATKTAYTNTADFTTTDGTHLEWVYDPVAHTLTRFVVAGSSAPSAVLDNVVSGGFTWSGAGSADLVNASWATVGDVAHCVAAIAATVSVSSRAGVAPQTQTVEASAPNQAGASGCGS